MPDGEMDAVVEFIHSRVVDPGLASQTDRELLKRFLADRDEHAFEALVRRHGPMILALCRRVLRDPHDAEDAFQAAFLVLVRRAATIARPELLGNWLYGVAFRTARAARAAAEKRRVKEAEAVPREQPASENLWEELQPFLDRELNRLPAKYRVPLVLCHLEEKSRQEAARALGLTEGTLSSRLARGRALLAQRLTRWSPSAAGGALLAGFGTQALSAALVQATIRAGMSVLVGSLNGPGLVPARVAVLSQGVLRSLLMTKLKIAAALLCVGGLLACAAVTATSRGFGMGGASPAASTRGSGTETDPPATGAPKGPNDSLMNQVRETTKDITDPQVKLRVLLRTASVQDKTGDPAGAGRTRQEAMEHAKGFAAGRPRADALLLVARSQIGAKDRTAALETLKHAEQAAAAVESENEKPNVFSRLVSAQAAAGDYEGGLRTLAKGGRNVQGYLLSDFCTKLSIEDKDAARKAVTRALAMVKFDDTREPLHRSNDLNGVSGACYALTKTGDRDRAIETAERLSKGNELDRCLQAIVSAQASDGDTAGATRTAQRIQQDDNKIQALDTILSTQTKAGDLAAARNTLNDFRKRVEKFTADDSERPFRKGIGWQPRLPDPRLDQWQAQIALTQLQLGDKRGALVTVANIESDLGKAHALMNMGANRTAAGKSAEAREMLLAASQAAQRVVPTRGGGYPSHYAKANTLRYIAREQALAGDVVEAFRTANTIPADEVVDEALAGIAPAQAGAGDLKGALETVAQIRDEPTRADALDELAQVLTQAGQEKDALDMAAQQTSPALKARAILGVLLGKSKAKLPKPDSPK